MSIRLLHHILTFIMLKLSMSYFVSLSDLILLFILVCKYVVFFKIAPIMIGSSLVVFTVLVAMGFGNRYPLMDCFFRWLDRLFGSNRRQGLGDLFGGGGLLGILGVAGMIPPLPSVNHAQQQQYFVIFLFCKRNSFCLSVTF